MTEIQIITDGRYCGIIEYGQVAFRCHPNDLPARAGIPNRNRRKGDLWIKEVPPDCLECKRESCDLDCGIKHSPKQKEIQIVILKDLTSLTREERLTILKQTIVARATIPNQNP